MTETSLSVTVQSYPFCQKMIPTVIEHRIASSLQTDKPIAVETSDETTAAVSCRYNSTNKLI